MTLEELKKIKVNFTLSKIKPENVLNEIKALIPFIEYLLNEKIKLEEAKITKEKNKK